ncbi:GDSL esterase/lipase At5g55050-like [Dendrobium catenatum]|uniref:GDSL esterase/lipase At5g55050-like n=1 Tax=Dendrobium catenatum TaxID=906689 RepID=UPI00109FF676|nr:GDSL esterase/lipase At5g55050-like [Dendrobium catenatum]
MVKLILLLSLCTLGATNGATAGNATVPAIYILGDSLVDVGNNNHLLTTIKADFPHNGVDFAGGKPTGRFCNGRNAADFIGMSSPNGENFQGECLSLNKQIEYLSTAYAAMVEQIGDRQTQEHLAKSIFTIIIGSNDIFDYVKSNGEATPQQFVGSLTSTLQGQLKVQTQVSFGTVFLLFLHQRIYNIGARKFSFIGTGPVGCCPALRSQSKTGECKEVANLVSHLYNEEIIFLLHEMKSQFSDMNYSFFNTYIALLEIIQMPFNHGFTEVKAACCGIGDLNAKVACTPFSHYCSNRTSHIFWDYYHPTEATAGILTAEIFDGSAPHVYPINMRQLGAL